MRSNIINLSSIPLSQAECHLLQKGFKFIPTQNRVQPVKIAIGMDRLVRSLKLKDFFHDNDNSNSGTWDPTSTRFHLPSTWVPPNRKLKPTTLQTIQNIEQCTFDTLRTYNSDNNGNYISHHANNLTTNESKALHDLADCETIIIKPSDKAGSIVVMDRLDYIEECERQLNDPRYYKPIPQPIYRNNIPKINTLVHQLANEHFITDKQRLFLLAQDDCRQRHFYTLPKVHKDPTTWPRPGVTPPGRPIVSDCNSECYNISKYIDSFLIPLSTVHPAYLKDTPDFISKITNQIIPSDSILVSGDVTALYTNMNLALTLQAVRQSFLHHPDPNRPSDILIKLLDITLNNNDFEFNGKTYLQTCGVPMGRVFSPSLANIFMQDFDRVAVRGLNGVVPLLYFRFLDDIFFIWPAPKDQLLLFQHHLNSIIPGVTITLTPHPWTIDFLDTTVFKFTLPDQTRLQTKVFFKPTATHQLLHSASFHPPHTRKGVLKSQLIRFRNISTNYTDFIQTCNTVFRTLRTRGYSRRMLRTERNKIWNTYGKQTVAVRAHQGDSIIPMVLPFNSITTALFRRWREIIARDPTFTSSTIIAAFQNNRNLMAHLVRSKFTTNPVPTTPPLG